MPEQFNRAVRLTVGTTQIDASAGANSGLRIGFRVERDEKRTPNNVEVRVYNLSRADAAALAKSDTVPVSLEAGFVGAMGQIFLGDLRQVRTRREGGDLVTTVTGGDGETKIRTARINRTFKAGATVGSVLKGLADALGVKPGNSAEAQQRLFAKLARPRTLCGLVYDELEDFCRTQGLRWSVQDSALQVRTDGQPVTQQEGPLLRNDSGLIGEPEVEVQGTVAKAGKTAGKFVSGICLLRSDIIPGVTFRVESPTFTGNLFAVQTVHEGDTHDTPWYCNWIGKPYG